VEEAFAGIPSGELREAVLYAGGAASGKSRLRDTLSLGDYVIVNPDLIRERLPEYREMLEAGDAEAAALTHDEASEVAKLVTNVAIQLGKPLILDAVGANDNGQFSTKIRTLLGLGYSVVVRYVTVPLELARSREQARALRTGSKVPDDVLIKGHREVSRGFLDIARISGVSLEVYDVTNEPPSLIAEGVGDADRGVDGIQVYEPEGCHRFVAKAER
jgi:chloramphenicol 3-O-phosphotransferase